MLIPADCKRRHGTGGYADDPSFVYFCVHDVPVEVHPFHGGRRLGRVRRIIFDCFVHAVRGILPLLDARKISGRIPRFEVLGWVLDTDKLTTPLPPRKKSQAPAGSGGLITVSGVLPRVSR